MKEILECVANVGYAKDKIDIKDLKLSDEISKSKINYHVKHLIKEDYLGGDIIETHGATLISITRMTDKGTLLINTTKNPKFLEWVKTQTGDTFGDLMKDSVKGSASIAWALAKQWLTTQGINTI